MFDRHRLYDEPAHRGSDDVRLLDTQPVEYREGIVGHVAECVERNRSHFGGGLDARARQRGENDAHVRDLSVELRRKSAVPVIKPDHEPTGIGYPLAVGVVPSGHLGGETHHKKNRRIGRRPERVVFKSDSGR